MPERVDIYVRPRDAEYVSKSAYSDLRRTDATMYGLCLQLAQFIIVDSSLHRDYEFVVHGPDGYMLREMLLRHGVPSYSTYVYR